MAPSLMTALTSFTVYLGATVYARRKSLLQQAIDDGPLAIAGFIAMSLAILLALYWVFSLFTKHRSWFMVPAIVALLGVGGYLAFDKEYITLHLSLRDAPKVREECQSLIEPFKQASMRGEDVSSKNLTPEQFPTSIRALKAKAVVVGPAGVEILLEQDPEREGKGFLYSQTERLVPAYGYRAMWHQDFYAIQD